MIKIIKPLEALLWRIKGNYDSNGPVRENDLDRAIYRAKYEVWKYSTFGPGKNVFRMELAYRFVEAPELQGEPLYLHHPILFAGIASIIAEMSGHEYISMMTPVGKYKTKAIVAQELNAAIERVVSYYIPDVDNNRNDYKKQFLIMLKKLEQYQLNKKNIVDE